MAENASGETAQQTFILQFSRSRRILLSVGLIVCAVMLLFWAGLFIWIGFGSTGLIGKAALSLLAIGLGALAAYLLLLLTVLAVRITVGPQHIELRLPRTRGPLPFPRLINTNLTYDAIRSVESRQEIYVSCGAVTVQEAYSLVTRDGTRLLLGAMSRTWGTGLPFDEAARRIAARLGQSVIDRGAVRVGGIVRAMIYDVPAWNTPPMPREEHDRWAFRGALTVRLLMGLLGVIALLRACAPH